MDVSGFTAAEDMEYVKEKIEDLVRRAKRLKISKLKLTRQIGIDYSTLHRWERGESEPLLGKFLRFQQMVETMEAAEKERQRR